MSVDDDYDNNVDIPMITFSINFNLDGFGNINGDIEGLKGDNKSYEVVCADNLKEAIKEFRELYKYAYDLIKNSNDSIDLDPKKFHEFLDEKSRKKMKEDRKEGK